MDALGTQPHQLRSHPTVERVAVGQQQRRIEQALGSPRPERVGEHVVAAQQDIGGVRPRPPLDDVGRAGGGEGQPREPQGLADRVPLDGAGHTGAEGIDDVGVVPVLGGDGVTGRVDPFTGKVGPVGEQAVDPHGEQPVHLGGVVDGPRVHLAAVAVHRVDVEGMGGQPRGVRRHDIGHVGQLSGQGFHQRHVGLVGRGEQQRGRQPRFQVPQDPQALTAEGLHDRRIGLRGGALGGDQVTCAEHADQLLLHRPTERVGRLGLDVEAQPGVRRRVAVQLLLERHDLGTREPLGGDSVIGGEPAAPVELPQLGQRQLLDVARPVGRPVHRRVVHAHQDPVAGHLQVALEEVGVLLDRQVVGEERVLGRVGAGPTVGEDADGTEWLTTLGERRGWQRRGEEDEQAEECAGRHAAGPWSNQVTRRGTADGGTATPP